MKVGIKMKKKMISFVMAAAMAVGMNLSVVSAAHGGTFQYGDVNGDGVINITDVTLTAAFIKGIEGSIPGFMIRERADVNGDGVVNVTDVIKIAAHVKGIKPLPERYYFL